jgi:hypothetical protein
VPDDDGSRIARRLRWGAESQLPEQAGDGWMDDLEDRPFGGEDAPLAATVPVEPRITGPSFERRELDRMDEEARDRRRQLWRDTSILLIGLLVVLLVGQVVLPATQGLVSSSATPGASDALVGPVGSGSPGPGATFVSIVDPSLGIDATHSPGPARTEPPTGSAAPTTRPIGTPMATFAIPTPTPAPTATPTPTPAPTPTPTPEDTPTPAPTPAPHAAFAWTQEPSSSIVDFTDQSTGIIDTWQWDFGDGGSSTNANPSHDFGGPGVFQVTLTVTGPGGQDAFTLTVAVL